MVPAMMSSKVMTAVVTTKMMSIVMSAVAPGIPVAIATITVAVAVAVAVAVTTIAIRRIEPRHIHVGRRLIAIILTSPMTATAAMAMSIAAFVSKMYRA